MLGGSGVFGSRICNRLARHPGLRIIAAGRNREALAACAAEIGPSLETRVLEAPSGLVDALDREKPDLVIHAAGPFQSQDYVVAEICITHGIHYIDIADGRDFVVGFSRLDAAARQAGVLAVSGASSVPALSAAVIEASRPDFARIGTVEIGLSPGNRAPRGKAVIAAFLSYAGRPFTQWQDGGWRRVYGWHDLRRRTIDGLGTRWFSACDVPDLALLPLRYPELRTVQFRAGLELVSLHLGLWMLAWLPRLRLLPSLAGFAGFAGWVGRVTLPFGTDRGGMFVELDGVGRDGRPLAKRWLLVAGAGHGPFVPATPAALLAAKLAQGALSIRGAMPCLGLFTLDEFRAELADLDIRDRMVTLRP